MSIEFEKIPLWGEDIPWLSGLREKGAQIFNNIGWPNAKTEAWKYSYFPRADIDNLMLGDYSHKCEHDCHCHEKTLTPFAAYGIKFCDGRLTSEHFDLPQGVEAKSLVEAIYDGEIKKYLNKSFEMENFPFAAMNTALLEQGLVLIIERGTIIDRPIFICYHQHNNNRQLSSIRNIIVLENRAQATIVEYFEGEADALYFNNVVNEIYLQNDATLCHYIYANEARRARHIALNSVNVRANASYKSFIAQGECALSRHESHILLQQEGATAVVNGAYRLAQNGVSDITTDICHLAAHTISNQLVRGVADGKSKGVFQGRIHIAPDAQQTEGYQQHRALLLSDEAEIDAKPELEIFADDVKCAHGNTCGDLDAEQLFYMQARGISKDDARRILIEAHINEALNTIADTNVQNWLKENF